MADEHNNPSQPSPANQSSGPIRRFDFVERYANSLGYESGTWDFKLIFGTSDHTLNQIQNHTAMIVPWGQAKLMAFYILANVLLHESRSGTVTVPQSAKPQPIDINDPAWKAIPGIEALAKRIEELQIDIFGLK